MFTINVNDIQYGKICSTSIKVTDDAVILYEDETMDGLTVEKQSTILTKEAFVECYNKWILGNNGGTDDGK